MALTRREFLQRLTGAYAAALIGGCSRRRDWFAKEQVCIHILRPREFIPAPLTETTDVARPVRRAADEYFNIGLPELAFVESRGKLLELFQYFWPFSREDLDAFERSVEIRYQKGRLNTLADATEFAGYLREHRPEPGRRGLSAAVVFTWNDFTRQWSPQIATACRDSGVDEFVVFKDPTVAPYLCEYPAEQRGFKRPPP